MFKKTIVILWCVCLFVLPSRAVAHPHVFLEANLEILKDEQGFVSEIRQVWRFDEIFTSSVILDFDTDGNGSIDANELQEVEAIIKENLKEFDYYTAIRYQNEVVEVGVPETFLVDFDGDQIIMIVAFKLDQPVNIKNNQFAVSISDPTYYVAVELKDKSAIEIAGDAKNCEFDIARPDFDKLYATNPEVFKDDFKGSDDPDVFSADEYLTWVNFNCA